MKTLADHSELPETLADLGQSLTAAHAGLLEVRGRVEACWPRKPSLTVLDAESHDLCKSAMALVAVPESGMLPNLIVAGANTLRALDYDPPDSLDVGDWQWSKDRVDREASPQPPLEPRLALRHALPGAEEWVSVLSRLIDDVDRLVPPESWLPQWTPDDALAYIGKVKWQYAFTMPKSPHYYTVRAKRPELTRDFLAMAQLIQSRGELKTWGGSVRAYLELDGWEYWTMGARVPETEIINRAIVGGPAAAQPLPQTLDAKLLKAVEYALAYRRLARLDQMVPAGILGQRLRSLLPRRD